MEKQFISGSCIGEKCPCGKDAVGKIEETIFNDDSNPRHPLTQYVCKEHLEGILQPYLNGKKFYVSK